MTKQTSEIMTTDIEAKAREYATIYYYDAEGNKKDGGFNPTKYEGYLAGARDAGVCAENLAIITRRALARLENGQHHLALELLLHARRIAEESGIKPSPLRSVADEVPK